jgi:hypothetical protein
MKTTTRANFRGDTICADSIGYHLICWVFDPEGGSLPVARLLERQMQSDTPSAAESGPATAADQRSYSSAGCSVQSIVKTGELGVRRAGSSCNLDALERDQEEVVPSSPRIGRVDAGVSRSCDPWTK